MKRVNIPFLIISFVILAIACSFLSMNSVGEEYRYTLKAMNPWNGVEGISFTISYFLHTSKTTSLVIGIIILLFMWWRLYLVLRRTFKR